LLGANEHRLSGAIVNSDDDDDDEYDDVTRLRVLDTEHDYLVLNIHASPASEPSGCVDLE